MASYPDESIILVLPRRNGKEFIFKEAMQQFEELLDTINPESQCFNEELEDRAILRFNLEQALRESNKLFEPLGLAHVIVHSPEDKLIAVVKDKQAKYTKEVPINSRKRRHKKGVW